ncbi:MAG TPA: PAS domain-containing protein, partial [Phycisphaerales bacterium]|nr:PAS domain-containing protein [Phycisphaerales bacterium]
MEHALSSEDLATIIHQNSEAVVVTDTDGVIIYANEAMATLSGYEIDELIGRTPSVFQSGKTPREVYDEMWRTIKAGRTWRGRLLNKRKPSLPLRIAGGKPGQGSDEYWSLLTITPVLGPDGTPRFFAASHSDITQKVALEERLAFEREEAKTRADIWEVLHGQEPIESRLARALERLVRLKDIEIENKCGIFIKNERTGMLDLFVVHGNFTEEFLTREKSIPLGNCLCGRAAVSGEVIVSDDCFCDDRHENTFVGMTRHGHYILPLKWSGEIIGVLFLYTSPYPVRAQHRIETLKSIADSLALAIVNDRMEKQLIETRDAARAASEAKSAFLANMSHEIRTPLNGIIGSTELLLREDDSISADERTEWITTIHNSGRHLLQLINNILDLSKVEAGQLDIEVIETSPVELITDLISTMRIQAHEKNISLDLLCQGPQPGTIETDPTRFRQILMNLIGNAIKFTERGGVSVRSYIDDQEDGQAMLRIDVSDTGTGIPPEKLETIFDPFTQADNSITRRFGGTGLGLAISKKLAESLGGSLTAWSQPGRGSTFTLTIPIGHKDEITIAEEHHTEAVRSKRRVRVEESAIDKALTGRALLVDDGETNRRLISRILERAGLDVACAVNGKDALDILEHESFDLILMDMQMPVLDG